MIVSAIEYNRNKNQNNNHSVKPVHLSKQDSKDESAENSYQVLLRQAMMVYQR